MMTHLPSKRDAGGLAESRLDAMFRDSSHLTIHLFSRAFACDRCSLVADDHCYRFLASLGWWEDNGTALQLAQHFQTGTCIACI
jgi:hypothetical protein